MLKCSFDVKKLINSDVIIVFREVKFSVSCLFCCFCAVQVVRASTKSETVTVSWLAQSIVVLNNYTSKYLKQFDCCNLSLLRDTWRQGGGTCQAHVRLSTRPSLSIHFGDVSMMNTTRTTQHKLTGLAAAKYRRLRTRQDQNYVYLWNSWIVWSIALEYIIKKRWPWRNTVFFQWRIHCNYQKLGNFQD